MNMYVTYSSDPFLDIFCVYTQSSDVMALVFHAKLTVCFITNINQYAGFILLKKCAQVLKIDCAMECPFTYCQRKKVVGAARFSFHIC